MILILTPLSVEFKALTKALARNFAGDVPPTVRLARAGHGKVEFALNTQRLIYEHRPNLVVGVGAAGSLDDRVLPGDLVLAEKIVEHDYNLHFVEKPLPLIPVDPQKLSDLRHALVRLPAREWSTHLGTIASGDEDIVDAERAKELKDATGALAVTWESAGLARACRMQKVPFLEIRAVTDRADKNVAEDFQKHLGRGIDRAAALLTEFILL